MNIIEAINSGKNFKRPHHKSWALISQHDLVFGGGILKEDLLADDWEIEQKAVPITLDQFWDAYIKARATIDHPNSPNLICNFMAKELGL